MTRLQQRTCEILFGDADDLASRAVNMAIAALIALNVMAFIVETMEPVYRRAPGLFCAIEFVSIGGFALEYLARLWSCVGRAEYRHP